MQPSLFDGSYDIVKRGRVRSQSNVAIAAERPPLPVWLYGTLAPSFRIGCYFSVAMATATLVSLRMC